MLRWLARAFLLVFVLFLGTSAPALHAEVVDIGNAELARLAAAGVPIIDIRTPSEWKESGIVPGSRLITLFDENGRADAATWLEKVRQVAKPEQPVIVICRSGNRTKAASALLSQQAGYAKVYNVKDGLRTWAQEGRAMAPVSGTVLSCALESRC